MRGLFLGSGLILASVMLPGHGAQASAGKFWANGDFNIPAPNPGGIAIVDTGERYGEWRVVGQAGNVTWVTGTYTHNGWSFPAPAGTPNWVNLTGISRSATGLLHAPVPVTVGAQYTLTFYVGNLVDTAGVYGTSSSIAVYANSKYIMTATNSGGAGTKTETWKPFSVTITADAPYLNIAFINQDPATDMNCGLGNTNLVPITATTSAHKGGEK